MLNDYCLGHLAQSDSYSTWHEIVFGTPQGLKLWSISFNDFFADLSSYLQVKIDKRSNLDDHEKHIRWKASYKLILFKMVFVNPVLNGRYWFFIPKGFKNFKGKEEVELLLMSKKFHDIIPDMSRCSF